MLFRLDEGKPLIPDEYFGSKNPALNRELVKKQIEADIERALVARGLMQVTGPSDLNVRYTFGAARKTELETYPPGGMASGRAL